MILDINRLNTLEREIYETLTQYAQTNGTLKITEAAELCDCSTSKISKFVKKLGFENFKQFMSFTQGELPVQKKRSNELERIRNFTEHFDMNMVDAFISALAGHERIIILGYGPSYICAQYLEYKLRIHSHKNIVAVPDLISAQNQIDEDTLLVIFSTTGRFTSFSQICEETRQKGGDILLLVEEYYPELLNKYENIFFLTDSTQPVELKPHEKSRTLFFIFIEEVIFKIMELNRENIE